MKKVLLTSTVLVAFAGAASAEVAITGAAEIGLANLDSAATAAVAPTATSLGVAAKPANDEAQFHSDIDVFFTMSGQSDNGLTFGANLDIDETQGPAAFSGNTQGGESMFVSGDFGRITMGDTDGAFDFALTEAIIGASLIDDNEHGGYNGNAGFDGAGDGQVLRYDYSFGALAAAISFEQIGDGLGRAGAGDLITGVGVSYSADLGGVDLGVGLGYQECDNCEIVGLSLSAGFGNGFTAIVNFSNADTNTNAPGDTDHVGFALGYSVDALTVAVNYGEFDAGTGTTTDGIGFIANYDLGGGLEAQFGYGNTSTTGAADRTTWSAGLAMSF